MKIPTFLIGLLPSSRSCPPPTKAEALFAILNWIFKGRKQTPAQKKVSVNAGKAWPQPISFLHGPVAAEERGPPGTTVTRAPPRRWSLARGCAGGAGRPGCGTQTRRQAPPRAQSAPLGDKVEAPNPPRWSLNPLLKMEAPPLQSRPRLGLAGAPRDAGRGPGPGPPGARRRPRGRRAPALGSRPAAAADVTAAQPPFAGLPGLI